LREALSSGLSLILAVFSIIASMAALLSLQTTLLGRVIDSLRIELTARLDGIEGRLVRLENKVERIDARLTEFELR
jgi:hypothetical protein